MIGLVDDTDRDQLRAALDRDTPAESQLDLGEQAIGGLKFAECIPDWLADSIALSRLTDSAAVDTVRSQPIDSRR